MRMFNVGRVTSTGGGPMRLLASTANALNCTALPCPQASVWRGRKTLRSAFTYCMGIKSYGNQLDTVKNTSNVTVLAVT